MEAAYSPLARPRNSIAVLLLAVTYASAAALSLLVAIPPGYACALWPPAGIALAACLVFGPRVWPGIVVGAAVANLGVIGTPALSALSIGAGNAAEAVIAAWLLQRADDGGLAAPAGVWRFAAVAFIAPLAAATNGVATLALAGQLPWAEAPLHWLTWWLGDATGIVIVTPLLLSWSEREPRRDARMEFGVFTIFLLLCAGAAWSARLPADTLQSLAYLMIPLVTWAAARLDRRAVTAASFVLAAVAVVDVLDGSAALFSPLSLSIALLLLQLFVSAVALTGLTLSAYASEVERLARALEAMRARAEVSPRDDAMPAGSATAFNEREKRILQLIADGHTSAEVGQLVHLSPRTIESYRARLMEKAEVPNFAQLVQYAVRHGFTSRR